MSYHHGNLSQALTRAGLQLLEQEGIDALTLRAAARAVGVSHTAPRRHFPSSAALLSEVAAEGFAQLGELMREVIEMEPWEARLRATGKVYLNFANERPALFTLMFRSERLDGSWSRLRNARASLFDALVAAGSPDGGLESTILAWAQVHGLAVLLLENQLGPLLTRSGSTPPAFVESMFR